MFVTHTVLGRSEEKVKVGKGGREGRAQMASEN